MSTTAHERTRVAASEGPRAARADLDEPRSREHGAAPDAAALLTAAQAGDERAFRALVAPHRRTLELHCYRMLGSLDDAEEVTQEALLRAWRSLHRFEGRAAILTWLYRIATN